MGSIRRLLQCSPAANGRACTPSRLFFRSRSSAEAPLARQTAKQLGAEHRELMLTGEDMLARLSEAVGALDQPSMDGINTFFVSWAARQVGLKVALSGLGGDEVFGGYPTFRSTPRVAALALLGRCLPAAARKPLASAMVEISRRGRRARRSDIVRKIAAIWSDPTAMPHPYFLLRMLSHASPGRDAIFGICSRCAAMPEMLAALRRGELGLEQTVEQAEKLKGDSVAFPTWNCGPTCSIRCCVTHDSMSMHHSLEVRVPLLDHPWSSSLPACPRAPSAAVALPRPCSSKLCVTNFPPK